ncbi:Trk system potassium transporter TrkA [Aerococcaceae bacterium WGS1372]
MKIIIAGGGKVGEKVCEELALENHDIIVIEKNEKRLNELIDQYDITGVAGNCESIQMLEEIETSTADIFMALTENDEINIISSILAKKLGATYTVARVRKPEYSKQTRFVQESFGINLIVNPEFETARYIFKTLNYTQALSMESFLRNRVSLIELEVKKGSILDNARVKDLREKFQSVIICIVRRENDEIIIPNGDTILYPNDRVHVTGSNHDMSLFMKQFTDNKRLHSSLIIGGGRIAYYLLQLLEKSHITTRVIEVNPDRAQKLAIDFPNSEIIVADGTNQDILDEQNIERFDSFISLTGIDEENFIVSVYAHHKGVKKVITKMDRTRMLKVLKYEAIRSVVTPKLLVTNEVIQFVRSRENSQNSDVEAVYRIVDNQAEAIQFRVKSQSVLLGVPISELKLKDHILIAYIVRDDTLIFPTGDDQFEVNDKVIVIAKSRMVSDIDGILTKG